MSPMLGLYRLATRLLEPLASALLAPAAPGRQGNGPPGSASGWAGRRCRGRPGDLVWLHGASVGEKPVAVAADRGAEGRAARTSACWSPPERSPRPS